MELDLPETAEALDIYARLKADPTLEVKDIAGLSEDSIEYLYQCAFALHLAGSYKEALNAFATLVSLSHHDARLWKGLGSCFEQLKEYRNAAFAYYLAIGLQPDEIECRYRTAKILIQLGQPENAENLLQEAVNMTGKDSHGLKYRELSKSLLSDIQAGNPKEK